MKGARYYSAIVIDNDDPERRGRLRLSIPELLDEDASTHPEWIPGRFPSGPGGGVFWIPPRNAVVIVEVVDAERLRWGPATLGAENSIPVELATDYPTRSGITSPDGGALIYLAESGEVVTLSGGNPRSSVEVKPGRVEVDATRIQLGGGGHGFILSRALLSDLAVQTTAISAFAVAVGAAAIDPAVKAAASALASAMGGTPGTMALNIAASLSAGPPYLSVRTDGD